MLDLSMFGVMVMLMLELHEKYMGEGNLLEDIDPVMFNSGLHSL